MAEQANGNGKKHVLLLNERHRAEISGVTEVESFDENGVSLVTTCGRLTLEGENLRVGALDIAGGTVVVEGDVSSAYYDGEDARPKRARTRRFFG